MTNTQANPAPLWLDVYDFDGTLFLGDSTVHFWRWCLRKKPGLVRYLPRQLWALLMTGLKIWRWQRGKSDFLCFFAGINVSAMARQFWQDPRVRARLMPWFVPEQSELPVVIISASPEITLIPIAEEFGVMHLIGTQVDEQTGVLLSLNCKGEEKIRRLHEWQPEALVRAMYTDDQKADGPLLKLAQQKYWVRGKTVSRIY